uniref:Uncharacterized protein n=1 Tax=Trichuris muris TaxID=70415 RepID=A0A5S6Q1L1_TRIMR
MASEIPVQSNNEVICNDVQITTGVEEVGVADHASNANISPNGFHLVALLSVQLRVLNDSKLDDAMRNLNICQNALVFYKLKL